MAGGQGRRNIAGREDIAPDALRQRRDLYALAIGLCIYNLAGGYVLTDTTVASIIPVKLSHPWVVLLAAWLGFAYFWWRFWLISEARPFADFHADAMWQAGNSRVGRGLAAEFTGPINFFGNERSGAFVQLLAVSLRLVGPYWLDPQERRASGVANGHCANAPFVRDLAKCRKGGVGVAVAEDDKVYRPFCRRPKFTEPSIGLGVSGGIVDAGANRVFTCKCLLKRWRIT